MGPIETESHLHTGLVLQPYAATSDGRLKEIRRITWYYLNYRLWSDFTSAGDQSQWSPVGQTSEFNTTKML